MIERYTQDRQKAYLAAVLIGYAMNIEPAQILNARRRTRAVARARQIAMYLLYAGMGVSMIRVALAFGRDRSTVAYACKQIEDRREDQAFDNWLDHLEQSFATIAAANRHNQ